MFNFEASVHDDFESCRLRLRRRLSVSDAELQPQITNGARLDQQRYFVYESGKCVATTKYVDHLEFFVDDRERRDYLFAQNCFAFYGRIDGYHPVTGSLKILHDAMAGSIA